MKTRLMSAGPAARASEAVLDLAARCDLAARLRRAMEVAPDDAEVAAARSAWQEAARAEQLAREKLRLAQLARQREFEERDEEVERLRRALHASCPAAEAALAGIERRLDELRAGAASPAIHKKVEELIAAKSDILAARDGDPAALDALVANVARRLNTALPENHHAHACG